MVTDLVILIVVLVLTAGVLGYFVERARQREVGPRERRVDDLRPLSDERVRNYRADWVSVQAQFVDDPDGAVRAADTLVKRLMAERGYPPAGSAISFEGLPSEEADAVRRYRAAREVTATARKGDAADNDALRRAMVHHRIVFSEVLERAVQQHAD